LKTKTFGIMVLVFLVIGLTGCGPNPPAEPQAATGIIPAASAVIQAKNLPDVPSVATSAIVDPAVPPGWELEPITVANVQRLNLLARFGEGGLGDELALSPDGRLLAVAADGGVVLYDAAVGEWVDFYPTSSNVTSLAFSPDSRKLAYFHRVPSGEKYSLDDPDFPGLEMQKPQLTLRSVPDGEVLYSLPTYGNGCGEYGAWELVFSPDGKRILFHDYFGRPGLRLGSLCVLDALDGSLLRAIQPESPWRVHSFTPLLPDGKTVWAAVVDDSRAVEAGIILNQLRRYNLDTGALEAQLDVPDSVRTIRLSPDGQWMVGGTPAQIRSAADGSLAAEIPPTVDGNTFSAARFSPDSGILALGAWDGSVGLYSVPQGQLLNGLEPIRSPLQTEEEILHILDLAFSPDGGILYSLQNSFYVDTPEVVQAVHLADQQEIFRISGRNTVDRLPALSPDHTLLAFGGYEDGSVQVWPTGDEELRYVLKGHTSVVVQALFSPDGSQIATASMDGTVRLWDAAEATQQAVLEAHNGGVWAIGYSTDGNRLVSVGKDGLLKLWNPADGSLLNTLETGTGEWQVNSISFMMGNSSVIIVSGCLYPLTCMAQGDGDIRSIDLNTGQVSVLLDKGALNLSSSADQSAFGFFDGGVQFGRIVSGNYQIQQSFTSPYGKGRVYGAVVSPDGSLLFFGNSFGVHVWDTASGQMIALAQDSSQAGNYGNMQLSTDGRILLIAGNDGVIYLWGVQKQ
jgi:WD40 repeat protein